MPSRPHALTPHIFVQDTPAAVTFYGKVFGATELFRNVLPDGRILFVELAMGGGRLLVSEEAPELNAFAPPSIGGTPMLLTLEADDVDDLARRAVFAGATVEMPVNEMFWGERYGIVLDPFGHRWALCTRREQYTPDDIIRHTPTELI